MKFILTIFFSLILVAVADANNLSDKIKIGSNAKTSELEIRYNSNSKKNTAANVMIIDANGKEVSSFTCQIKRGSNVVCLHDALNLTEGLYTVKMTVKKKTTSTKFVLFK